MSVDEDRLRLLASELREERDRGRVPLHVQVRHLLAFRIGTRVLGPGERLPAASVLAAALDAPVISIRRAFRDLVARGLIEERDSGQYVADYDREGMQEAMRSTARESTLPRSVAYIAEYDYAVDQADYLGRHMPRGAFTVAPVVLSSLLAREPVAVATVESSDLIASAAYVVGLVRRTLLNQPIPIVGVTFEIDAGVVAALRSTTQPHRVAVVTSLPWFAWMPTTVMSLLPLGSSIVAANAMHEDDVAEAVAGCDLIVYGMIGRDLVQPIAAAQGIQAIELTIVPDPHSVARILRMFGRREENTLGEGQ